MKFFIDTANLAEIREAYDLGILDGVTTNPSLMAKEGITGEANVRAHYKAICEIVDDKVSAEVIATDFEGMIREGKELAKIDDKIVVKIPIIKGVDVIDENGQIIDRVTSATILRSAIAHSPRQGDFMVATIGTTRYDVQRILSDDGYAVRVSVT